MGILHLTTFSSGGVWNLKRFYLEDYINEYSGGTIRYTGLLVNNEYSQESSSEIVNYTNMKKIIIF